MPAVGHAVDKAGLAVGGRKGVCSSTRVPRSRSACAERIKPFDDVTIKSVDSEISRGNPGGGDRPPSLAPVNATVLGWLTNLD